MKKLMTTLVALLFTASVAWAQDETPDAVKEAFKTKYPKQKKVEWVKSADNQWQAEFEMRERDIDVVFDEDGNWLGTHSEMDINKLPDAVKKAIAEKYAGYTVQEAEMVEVSNAEKMYKVELENGDLEMESMFYADGRVVPRADNKEVEERELEEMEED